MLKKILREKKRPVSFLDIDSAKTLEDGLIVAKAQLQIGVLCLIVCNDFGRIHDEDEGAGAYPQKAFYLRLKVLWRSSLL